MYQLQIAAMFVGLIEIAMSSLAAWNLARALQHIHAFPVDIKFHTPTRDEEQARDHQKEPFGFESVQADGSQGQRRGGGINWLRLVRNVAGLLLLYPTCMLVMSNYAVTRGLLQGCSRLEVPPLGISLVPQCILRPSPLAFFCASVVWTVLEYVHYYSNAEDKFQKPVLGGAVVLGLLLCVGCTWDALGIVFQTMPWIIHSGLVASDLSHGAWRKRCNAARPMALP